MTVPKGFKPYSQLLREKAERKASVSDSPEVGVGKAKTFSMGIEPHTPLKPGNACQECVLAHGPMCLDRSYCEFPETGKTWRKIAS